ncbi:MAG: cytochrome c biogenesis protein CcsA [Promethearchaeota archaeon]
MVYSFLNNIYKIIYVWSFSNNTLPIVYKIVAVWAGEEGSIMTWMLFNTIIINLFRMGNRNKEDLIFIRSAIMSSIILSVFLIILLYLNPFKLQSSSPSDGLGLSPLLISPFMIWHPFFTFIAYGIFLIPFTITIAEILSRNTTPLGPFQQNFYKFTLKFGWLVLTLSIGLGAYWAKIALTPWGRYWGWDQVETVSLIPWFFITAYFHTMPFQKKNPNLVKINLVLIFIAIIFSTLITRAGISPIHSFTGVSELIIWLTIIGLILTVFSLYVIYIVLDYVLQEYRKTKLLFDYLSYIFLFSLSFVCIFGLFVTPLTIMLSYFFPINIIYIGPDFFMITTLILAICLALSLTFCNTYGKIGTKLIIYLIIIVFAIQSIFSIILLIYLDVWINPLIAIFFTALIVSIWSIIKNLNFKKGIKHFFKINSKTIIHAGISFILIGFLINQNYWIFQDIFYITGFIFLLSGIIPSIIMTLFVKH